MPLVALVLMTLMFWVIYWFLRMGGIEHFRERAALRKDEECRAKARELERTACLRAVDDPRDAATVLMLLITRGGDPTPQQTATIERTIISVFGFSDELLDRMTNARFVASSAESFEQAARLFSQLLNTRLTDDERLDLITMVERVARLDGPLPSQIDAIALLRQKLGLLILA
jgi:uncharacterized tellurite resistance protein B-like protein